MRQIDWDAPLSEDDKEWLRARDKHAEIEANEQRFAGDEETDEELETVEETDEEADEPDDDYDSWKAAELKAEANSRTPAIDTAGFTKRAEYITALRVWDGEHGE